MSYGSVFPGRGLTPKALANFSPVWSAATTLGRGMVIFENPEKGLPTAEPLQGLTEFSILAPGLSLRSNPGLQLTNACGVS